MDLPENPASTEIREQHKAREFDEASAHTLPFKELERPLTLTPLFVSSATLPSALSELPRSVFLRLETSCVCGQRWKRLSVPLPSPTEHAEQLQSELDPQPKSFCRSPYCLFR
jgi:hypothetical protein